MICIWRVVSNLFRLRLREALSESFFEAVEVRQYKILRETQLIVCSAIDLEELLSTVGSDGLRDKRCRALTASHVNVFAKAFIGYIHLT